ncbi:MULTISPECIES: hypothetical protein [unclassified Microcoleus]|uniref:hypothetical protein n=1 Tax=unclassified Microcoleus TaxID=2642155 RepID=UPI002FCF69E3
MSQGIFNKILNQLDTLEVLELQQLERAIGNSLAQKEQAAQRTRFHQALLTSGLVKKIKHSSLTQQTQRRLIPVQGQPVSETIIEERR